MPSGARFRRRQDQREPKVRAVLPQLAPNPCGPAGRGVDSCPGCANTLARMSCCLGGARRRDDAVRRAITDVINYRHRGRTLGQDGTLRCRPIMRAASHFVAKCDSGDLGGAGVCDPRRPGESLQDCHHDRTNQCTRREGLACAAGPIPGAVRGAQFRGPAKPFESPRTWSSVSRDGIGGAYSIRSTGCSMIERHRPAAIVRALSCAAGAVMDVAFPPAQGAEMAAMLPDGDLARYPDRGL